MELTQVAAKYKGKVSAQFIQCLPYFKEGQAKKIGTGDYVKVSDSSVLLIHPRADGHLTIAVTQLNYSTLTIYHGDHPGTRFRALAVADYFGVHLNPYVLSPQSFSMGSTVTTPASTPAKSPVTLTFKTILTTEPEHAPAPFTPVQAPEKKEETWELYTDKLMPVASDFYLLASASAKAPWVRYYYISEARRTARLIGNYLAMAIGGEIHYSRSKPPWLQVTASDRKGSAAQWKAVWDKLGGVEATTKAAKLFQLKGNWPGHAYGGPKWARIADALQSWLTGQMSDVLFVDHCMDLQHNTETVFNKWFTDLSGLKKLLDAKFKGDAAVLMRSASPNVRRIYLNTVATPDERIKWAKEYGVERVRME